MAERITHRLPTPSAQRVRSLASLLNFVFIGAYLAAQPASSAKILNVFFGTSTSTGVIGALAAVLAYCTTDSLLRLSIHSFLPQQPNLLDQDVEECAEDETVRAEASASAGDRARVRCLCIRNPIEWRAGVEIAPSGGAAQREISPG